MTDKVTEHDLDVLITKAQYAAKQRTRATYLANCLGFDDCVACKAEENFDDYYRELREKMAEKK